MTERLTIATWSLAGLLVAAALSLAFVPIVESISTGHPHLVPTTIFQHPGTPGPSNPIAKAALYTVGTMLFLAAALRFPLRYGVMMTVLVFGLSVSLTVGSIRGLVGGWVLLRAWLILATGTLASGGLVWLKLVELHTSRRGRQLHIPPHITQRGQFGVQNCR